MMNEKIEIKQFKKTKKKLIRVCLSRHIGEFLEVHSKKKKNQS
jgi:hypothetical protein